MKIFYSPLSPYVRKCMVVALELGLTDRIEKINGAANPITRDPAIVAKNPLGKVPTFIAEDGTALYDSRVICEYLNELGKGTLIPASGSARWQVMTEQSLGDGILTPRCWLDTKPSCARKPCAGPNGLRGKWKRFTQAWR